MTTTKPLLRLDFASAHRTYRNAAGEKVPGVTSVLSLIPKPALLAWANSEGLAGRKIERVSRDAADTGTVAHGLVEAYLTGRELDVQNVTPEMLDLARGGFSRFMDWWVPLHARLLHSEYSMVSERLQVGGTADIVAEFGLGGLLLADGKSSKRIYDEYLIQAAVYADIYTETTGTEVDRVYVVRFGKGADDVLEVKEVTGREAKVSAFAALADARRKLQAAGIK